MGGDARVIRHVVVRGRVQGVGYRAWTADEAALRGLEGWVRNRRDGSVEAVIAGPADAVAEMIKTARRGPFTAHVTSLDMTETSADVLEERRGGESFSVLSTR